jgi:CHAT domain-containing protein
MACRRSEIERGEARYSQIEELFLHGQLDAALTEANQALRETSDPQWMARFRVEAAKVRQVQGQNNEVIRLLDQDWAAAIADPNLAVERLTILSLAYARQGNTQRAMQAISGAEALCNSTPSVTPFVRAELLAAKGRFALEENRLPAAKALFQTSLAAARAGSNRFFEASALLNLSFIDLQEDHYEDALEQAEATTSVAKSIGAEQLIKTSLGNAGWAYYEMGDYQRALTSFNDAAASAASRGSTLEAEHWLNTAGMSEARLGRLDAARDHYNRALVLARSLKNASEIAQVDQALAALFLHTSQSEQAEKYIDEARTLAQQEGSAFDIQLGNLLKAQYLAQRGALSNSEEILLTVERQTQQFPTTQLDAQHTLAQVCEKSGDNKQAETWYERSIATYREQRSQLQTDDARLPFFANGRDLYMDYVAFLIRNQRTDEALAVIDQGRAETLAEGLGMEGNNASIKLRKLSLIALARKAHADILVYALSPQGSHLWAANSKQSGFYTLPDRAEILAQIASHRRAVLAARDLLKEQNSAARNLYDMLVKPAEHLIHPGDRVYIVADDGMHGLNFESLLTPGESSHYWIEDVTITNLASLRLLAPVHHPARESAQQQHLLVIGNPVYSGQQYAPLPNAAAEVANVAEHFPANVETVLTGTTATPDAYLQSDPSRFDYIHFVSHAVASELVPLDSAVILSPHGTSDSAKLYARDILSKPLDAQLVTISACQGSGVRAYAGEGLVGLAWAFLRAGSRNVIGALWDVSDASTPELMQHLYDGIAAGQPPDVSLRAAKLEMLHSRGVFRKPIYWSAFQLYSAGD